MEKHKAAITRAGQQPNRANTGHENSTLSQNQEEAKHSWCGVEESKRKSHGEVCRQAVRERATLRTFVSAWSGATPERTRPNGVGSASCDTPSNTFLQRERMRAQPQRRLCHRQGSLAAGISRISTHTSCAAVHAPRRRLGHLRQTASAAAAGRLRWLSRLTQEEHLRTLRCMVPGTHDITLSAV
jgi:hypothetical protein